MFVQNREFGKLTPRPTHTHAFRFRRLSHTTTCRCRHDRLSAPSVVHIEYSIGSLPFGTVAMHTFSGRSVAILAAVLLLPLVVSQDPLYHGTKRSRRVSAWHHSLDNPHPHTSWTRMASSSRPWRPPTSTYQRPRRDYLSYYLDYDEARSDKKARLWQAQGLTSRQPGRLSLTSRIVWANIIMYCLQMYNPKVTTWGVKRSDLILQGRELYRLFSPVWLHANPGHLFTNMLSLQRLGPDVEALFGKGRFMATYLMSGVAGNVVSSYMSPNPGLGAR